MTKEIAEALKTFIRTTVLGMIPVISAVLLFIKSGIDVEVGTFNINWIIALAILTSGFIGVVQTAMMTAVDKWLHEKDVKTPLDMQGGLIDKAVTK